MPIPFVVVVLKSQLYDTPVPHSRCKFPLQLCQPCGLVHDQRRVELDAVIEVLDRRNARRHGGRCCTAFGRELMRGPPSFGLYHPPQAVTDGGGCGPQQGHRRAEGESRSGPAMERVPNRSGVHRSLPTKGNVDL